MMDKPLLAAPEGRQLRIAAIVFALLLALLGAAYFAFLRTEYAVLHSGLRPAEAAAIVAELDEKGVAYKLRDGGATILVPETETDAVRLSIVGSDAAAKGNNGFELFNKSDIGLTDFAQKINYQRALQGELARTIMMMDGIADARVHLALPEKSVFRGNRSEPKAAVTIAMRSGVLADDARVAGIQRLVAAGVPDLAVADVIVLDEMGRVKSASAVAETALSPELEERAAAELYYRARARAAIERVDPSLKAEVRVLILDSGAVAAGAPAARPLVRARGSGARRDFLLRLTIATERELEPEQRNLIGDAVSAAVELNPAAGDSLGFAVGKLAAPPPAAPATAYSAPLPSAPSAPLEAAQPGLPGVGYLAAAAAALALLLLAVGRRRGSLSRPERAALVERVRRELAVRERSGDVAA